MLEKPTMAATVTTHVSNDTESLPASRDAEMAPVTHQPYEAEEKSGETINWNLDTDEWTILVKLATTDINDDVDFVKIHKTIFGLMKKTDEKLTFKAKDGKILDSAEKFPKGNTYKAAFTTRETKNMFLTAHPVISTMTLDEIKRKSPELIAYLQLHNIYLDLSATGSLSEIVLGPWFGVHPDFTAKNRLKQDLQKLITINASRSSPLADMLSQAKANLPFATVLPSFQLRTRRIKREIEGVEYSAKTTVFICALEHREFWEEILVAGMDEGYLSPLGRFYLLDRDDHSQALAAAISWHNQSLNSMKAIIIRGIEGTTMDSGVRPPHRLDERPTLRDKLHQGGFLTIVSTNENKKWIGVAKDAETAMRYVNMDLKDLCATAYDDGTAPVATSPERRSRNRKGGRATSQTVTNEDKSSLFERQTKSWADIAAYDVEAISKTHTETNIARRPRNAVRFKSHIRFDIPEVVVTNNTKPDEETKISTQDGMTALTQDDLRSMKEEINAQMKLEISSAISELSINSAAKSTNEAFEARINEEMKEHNKEMKDTMKSMQAMMMSMQQFLESKTHAYDRNSDDDENYYDNEDDQQEEQEADEDPIEDDGSDDASFKEVQQFPTTQDDDKMESSPPQKKPPKQGAKRDAARAKGESPAAKKGGSYWDTVLNSNGPGRGRGGRKPDPPKPTKRRSLRKNLDEHFKPLSTSNAASSSGLN
jgi:hypothetical protein